MIQDLLQIIWTYFKNKRIRSYLTMLGIIIGVTALVSLITLGNSLQDGLTAQLDQLGARRLFIGPQVSVGGGFGPPSGAGGLTINDVETLERLSFLDYVTGAYGSNVEIEYGREKVIFNVFAIGTEHSNKYFEEIGTTYQGRLFNKGDRKVAIVGYKFATEYFDKELFLGSSFKIEGQKYRVIAIKDETGDQGQDFSVNIPLEDMQEIKGTPDDVSGITAVVKSGIDLETAERRIERELERKRGDENFRITSPQKIKEQTDGILGVVQYVVIAIAGISLLVGGLGIMNSMYTSVMERTRDIGTMKAIGARNEDILTMFIIESGILGLVGGSIGIILGLLISFAAVSIVNLAGFVKLVYAIDTQLVIFSLVFSFVLGVISGVLPAYRASKLKPVDALRYE